MKARATQSKSSVDRGQGHICEEAVVLRGRFRIGTSGSTDGEVCGEKATGSDMTSSLSKCCLSIKICAPEEATIGTADLMRLTRRHYAKVLVKSACSRLLLLAHTLSRIGRMAEVRTESTIVV